jgi:cytoskeleton-associated protein 5
VFKALPKIFGHADKNVRAEGSLLVQSFYSYVGDAIQPAIAELKPVQIKEINEACDALKAEGKGPGAVKPERLTRAGARERGIQEAAGEEEAAPAAVEVDPMKFMMETDVVAKPAEAEGLYANLAFSKWTEEMEMERSSFIDDWVDVSMELSMTLQDTPMAESDQVPDLSGLVMKADDAIFDGNYSTVFRGSYNDCEVCFSDSYVSELTIPRWLSKGFEMSAVPMLCTGSVSWYSSDLANNTRRK